MGNSSSKPDKASRKSKSKASSSSIGGKGFQSKSEKNNSLSVPFTRSDTQSSSKSAKSSHSRLSTAESFVSAIDSPSASNPSINPTSGNHSRSHSSTSLSNNANNTTTTTSNQLTNNNTTNNTTEEDYFTSKGSSLKTPNPYETSASNGFTVPLTPGPSILATATDLSTPSGGVSTQDIDSNSAAGDRPRLHRRTYSSSSIIGGGVVNIMPSTPTISKSEDNSTASLSNDQSSNNGSKDDNIQLNESENNEYNNQTSSVASSAIDTNSNSNSLNDDKNNASTVIENSSTSSFNDSTSTPNINGVKRSLSLTIPIPSSNSGVGDTASTPGSTRRSSGTNTPNASNESADPFSNSFKRSGSSASITSLKIGNSIMTSNGPNSPGSQFVTPLSSPLPREGSSGNLGGLSSSVSSNSSGRKLGLRTPSFNSSSVSSSSHGGLTLNIDEAIQRLLDAGYRGRTSKHVCLKNNEIALICQTARDIFLSQPVVLDLSPPVKVVGDVHGQYSDLIRLFDMCGFPPAANYLFLGDYVDRGKQSLETILLLFCYKIKYPENFFLLRGNHECANVTRVYGFYDECKRRTNIKTWKIFIDTFNTLPVAAIIAQKIFCVHGGLSPSLTNMNQLRSIQRPTDVPDFGLLNDILWSDPADTENEWEDNERGVSYCFNKVAINKFLAKFGFDLVCRAHIVVEDGYEFFNERTLVTVFSAPNYCGEFDNWGAVMSVSEDLLCSFELLKPLDSMALRQEMQKSRRERKHNALAATPLPNGGPQSF